MLTNKNTLWLEINYSIGNLACQCYGQIIRNSAEIQIVNAAAFTSYAVEQRCFAATLGQLDCKESASFAQTICKEKAFLV